MRTGRFGGGLAGLAPKFCELDTNLLKSAKEASEVRRLGLGLGRAGCGRPFWPDL